MTVIVHTVVDDGEKYKGGDFDVETGLNGTIVYKEIPLAEDDIDEWVRSAMNKLEEPSLVISSGLKSIDGVVSGSWAEFTRGRWKIRKVSDGEELTGIALCDHSYQRSPNHVVAIPGLCVKGERVPFQQRRHISRSRILHCEPGYGVAMLFVYESDHVLEDLARFGVSTVATFTDQYKDGKVAVPIVPMVSRDLYVQRAKQNDTFRLPYLEALASFVIKVDNRVDGFSANFSETTQARDGIPLIEHPLFHYAFLMSGDKSKRIA
jgi:hypothetical protein